MPETNQITLTLRTDQIDQLEAMAEDDNPQYRSKSEAARWLLDKADEADDLEQELDYFKNANKVIIDRFENTEMEVKENEDTSLLSRLNWLLRGK